MATLNLKSIATFVSDFSAAVQSSASALIDFSTGSVLLAVAEASSAVGMWLQGLILTVLTVARLSTSSGSDVDSFIADFNMPPRLGNKGSSGVVTFGRYTPTVSALVPVGAQVQSADGFQVFTVTADITNPAYSASLNGYVVNPGTTTVSCPVVSVAIGPATNVVAHGVNRLLTSISNIDYCDNQLAMAGGVAQETDAQVKSRFILYILGLTKGTIYGVESALANLNISIQYQIVDQHQTNGSFQTGFFYVVVDDGSGTPPPSFISQCTTAVQAVKPLGVQFIVIGPTLVTANVGMILTTLDGYDHGTVVGQVSQLITANITALGLGNGLPYTQLAAWAYSIPGVANAASITLNGGTSDIAANPQDRIMPGTISVS